MHETGAKTKLCAFELDASTAYPTNRGRTKVAKSRGANCIMPKPILNGRCVSNPAVCGLHWRFTVRASRRWYRMSIVLRGSFALMIVAVIGSACSGSARDTQPLFGTGVFHSPPKPGDSIAHSQMCECKTCDPANCCDGPEDDAPEARCGDRYDFSAGGSCGGLSIKSCSSRCARQIWRVRSGQDCRDRRPETCCQAG